MNKWNWIMMCLVVAAFLEFIRAGMQQEILYDYHNVRVEKTAPFEYWLTPEGKPRFHTTICRDYMEPGFGSGMVLSRVILLDKGSCWSLDPNKHAGYWIERGQDGRPIIETAN